MRCIGDNKPVVTVFHKDRLPDGVEDALQKLFGLRQLLFGAFAGGDVLLDGDKLRDFAPGIADGGDGGGFPIHDPALFAVVEFAAPDPAGNDGRPHLPVGVVGHFTGFEQAGILPVNLRTAVTGQLAELGVDVFDAALAVGDHDGGRALLHHMGVLAQGGLGLFAVGDFLNHAVNLGDGTVGHHGVGHHADPPHGSIR